MSLETSDQGQSIARSKVGSEIFMREQFLEGGCSHYNAYIHMVILFNLANIQPTCKSTMLNK